MPHLSSQHDDGTPGRALLIEMRGVEALHAELCEKGYPFLKPGIGPGPGDGQEMHLIDPASNRLRFSERAASG